MVMNDDVLDELDSLPSYASPNPTPARGVYGFALFVCSWFALAVYLIWALIPTPYLEFLHLTYVPAKYWAIAIPLLLPIVVVAFVIFVFAHNLIQLHGIFDDVDVIDDDFGEEARIGGIDLQSYLTKTSFTSQGKGANKLLAKAKAS